MTFSFCWRPRGAFPSGVLSVLSVLSTQQFSQSPPKPRTRGTPKSVRRFKKRSDGQSVLSQHFWKIRYSQRRTVYLSIFLNTFF